MVMTRLFRQMPLLLCLLLSACIGSAASDESSELSGRILLWHSWDNPAAQQTLDTVLQNFSEIYPGVRIVSVSVPIDDLQSRYVNSAHLGLGPDLVIAPSTWIRELADADLIRDITSFEPTVDQYFAVTNVRYNERIYGLPFSLRPVALYYNSSQVGQPPATLDDLLTQAQNGNRVALNTRFSRAFWGVQAFGGQLFDDDDRVILDQGGFANWLNWLRSAQDVPGIILSRDSQTLLELFTSGDVAYFVGTPEFLPQIVAALGENNVAVAPLPANPGNQSGPLLRIDALLFNKASSDEQTQVAFELANFLTNTEQSNTFVREVGVVPANRMVRVDTEAFPVVSGFIAQSRTAIPMPNTPQMEQVLVQGDDLFVRVLEGVIDGNAAAQTLTDDINREFGLLVASTTSWECAALQPTVTDDPANDDTATPEAMPDRLVVWHSWSDSAESTLLSIAEDYEQDCDIEVELNHLQRDDLLDRYQATPQLRNPHLFIGPDEWILGLADGELIAPIPAETLQPYVVTAQNALRYNENVYGIPISLELVALYYNNDIIENPATTLDELRTQAQNGVGVALPATFESAYWGISASGGRLFDEDNRLILDQTGLVEWLTWLRDTNQLENVIVSSDTDALRTAFSTGEVGYFVGPPAAMATLEETLSSENVSVTTLPAGPGGNGDPFLSVESFLVNNFLTDQERALALNFAGFATTPDNQRLLMTRAGRLPANVNVILEADDSLAGFQAQVELSTVPPNITEMIAVRQLGDRVYTDVLVDGLDPAAAAQSFVAEVNILNGFPPPTPEVTPETTDIGSPSLTAEATNRQ